MGMSIDLHIYDFRQMMNEVRRLVAENGGLPEGRTYEEFVDKILPKFGILTGGEDEKFITLWNEYYSDSGYNAGSELFRAVEMYFGVEDVFLGNYTWGEHSNADEVFESLGIKPIGEDYDDE